MLTPDQQRDLRQILDLVVESADFPAENTEARLAQRSGLPSETVAWALDVLCLDGKGWLDFIEHPRNFIRAYKPNSRFSKVKDKADDLLVGLYSRWSRHTTDAKHVPEFVSDPEDPDDMWVPGVYEDD